MSDVSRALEQIAEIHGHLAKGEVYRGWRSAPVAVSGLLGIAAAAYQAAFNRPLEPFTFVVFWLAVATAALIVGCSEIVWHYARSATSGERRRTNQVLGQFLPALVAGALVSVALVRLGPVLATLLPGLWALLFGVGIFSARPYLPPASVVVAAFYWTAGITLLWTGHNLDTLSPWMVGGPFGAGQLLTAGVLYWNLERHS
jgi:hypothetical protein